MSASSRVRQAGNVTPNVLEREDELGLLHSALAEARRGRGGIALVAGEAGAGKTTLVREFLRGAAGRPRVLFGACDPLTSPRTLGPLIDAAAPHDPEIARRLAAGLSRASAFAAVAELLDNGDTTVFVIEDAHWADEVTLDLLTHVGRRIDSMPVLLLLTFRDDEIDGAHPFRVRLGDLGSTIRTRVRLRPLSLGAVATLTAGTALDAVELHRTTHGNAFFVSEVIGAGSMGVPESVRDAVLARRARLPTAAKAALDAAAIMPGRVDVRVLREIVSDAGTDAEDGLDTCLERGVLVTDESGSIVFRHELARVAIDAAIPQRRRREMHRRAYAALVHLADASDVLLTHHAAAAGDGVAVLRHASRAALAAAAAGAHGDALALFDLALVHDHLLPIRDAAELRSRQAHELRAVARLDEALSAFERASALFDRAGDTAAAAEQTVHASRMLVTLGRQPEADRLLDSAAAMVVDHPPSRAAALIVGHRATYLMLARRLAECEAIAGEAIELAEHVGADDVRAETLIQTGIALAMAGEMEAGIDRVRRGIDLADAIGHDRLKALGLSQIGSGCGELRRYDLAIPALEAGSAFCEARELVDSMHYLQAWLARCRLELGEWEAAAALAAALLRNPRCVGISRFVASVTLAWIRARRGDPDVAALVDEALEHAKSTCHLQRLWPVAVCRAEIAWLEGRLDDELELVVEAAALATSLRWRPAIEELDHWQHVADGRPHGSHPDALTPFGYSATGDHLGAADAWRQLGCPYEEAVARLLSGRMEEIRDAHATFDRLGATPMRARAAAMLRELGATVPRGATARTRANPYGLTDRELEVLAALVSGRTNPQIAGDLGISVKTVGHHVSKILTKLDASTRAEAAVAATRLGLVG